MRATLTYHSIDDSGSAISIAPRVFAAHVDWLIGGRVRVLSLDALTSHPDEAGDAVAITFDDAFRNAREGAERLLSHGVPVAFFVVSGHVGGTNGWDGRSQPGIPTLPLLDWSDLEQLASRGATIGAHSRTHRVLTGLDAAALTEELDGGAEDIRVKLGARPTHFAYPYGEVDAPTATRTAASFRFAHTTAFRPLSSAESPLLLPRLDMYYFQASGALEAWGTPAFARRVAWCRFRRAARSRLIGGWTPRKTRDS